MNIEGIRQTIFERLAKENLAGKLITPLVAQAGRNTLDAQIPLPVGMPELESWIKSHCMIIPEKFREKTFFTGVQNMAMAVDLLKGRIQETNSTGAIILEDVDGPLAQLVGLIKNQRELDVLNSANKNGMRVNMVTNRQPWFPGTAGIEQWLNANGHDLYTGMDQQNPFNMKGRPNWEPFLDRLAGQVQELGGRPVFAANVDVVQPLPPTWNDFAPPLTNAHLVQRAVVELAARGDVFPQGFTPEINIFGINPFLSSPVPVLPKQLR